MLTRIMDAFRRQLTIAAGCRISMQHRFEPRPRFRTRLLRGNNSEHLPHGDVLSTVGAMLAMLFDLAGLLAGHAALQIVRQQFGDLFAVHCNLLGGTTGGAESPSARLRSRAVPFSSCRKISRSCWSARCTRTFTAPTSHPSRRAIS